MNSRCSYWALIVHVMCKTETILVLNVALDMIAKYHSLSIFLLLSGANFTKDILPIVWALHLGHLGVGACPSKIACLLKSLRLLVFRASVLSLSVALAISITLFIWSYVYDAGVQGLSSGTGRLQSTLLIQNAFRKDSLYLGHHVHILKKLHIPLFDRGNNRFIAFYRLHAPIYVVCYSASTLVLIWTTWAFYQKLN